MLRIDDFSNEGHILAVYRDGPDDRSVFIRASGSFNAFTNQLKLPNLPRRTSTQPPPHDLLDRPAACGTRF